MSSRQQPESTETSCVARDKSPSNASDATSVTSVESSVMTRAIKELEDAIELMPYHDKEEYLIAKQRVPTVVARETNPAVFLRYAELDIWAAAKRLVTYWRVCTQLCHIFAHFNTSGVY